MLSSMFGTQMGECLDGFGEHFFWHVRREQLRGMPCRQAEPSQRLLHTGCQDPASILGSPVILRVIYRDHIAIR